MSGVDQLVDVLHGVQRAAVCPIGILVRLQIGIEDRFENQHLCRLHHPISDGGLPQITVGSAPALAVSWPAQRSLRLRPTDSPSRLMRPSTPEAPTALLPPPPLRLLPGGAIQFPGGPYSRFGPTPFHGALQSLVVDPLPQKPAWSERGASNSALQC